MNRSIALHFLATAAFIAAHSASAQSTPDVEHIETIINAKPLERTPPKYPVDAARKSQEGWTRLSFVIDKEGNVVDPIIQDSSGVKSIDREALKAIKNWKYSPAMQNGEAIEQCQMQVQLDFKLSGEVGVTRKFMNAYRYIMETIKENKLDDAQQKLAELAESQKWNMTESAYFYFADAMYANKINDKKRELSSINRALAAGDDALNSKEKLLYMLERQFVLFTGATEYAAALATFAKIKEQKAAEQPILYYQPYADKIQALVHSDQPMVRHAQINDDGFMYHTLSRDSFSLALEQGALDEVQIRCANKRSRFTVAEQAQWKIPSSWGQCTIFVTGSPNSEFQVIELGSYNGQI
jgi:TonB family protein